MDDIKTYNLVNQTNEAVSFKIIRMLPHQKKDLNISSSPHRHDFYTALLIEKGFGKHLIDFSVYDMGEHQVHFVSPGQVHNIIDPEKMTGYTILFSTEFLIDHNIPLHFIEDLNLFNNYGESPPLQLTQEQYIKLANFCNEMIIHNSQDDQYKTESIAAYLKLILITCNSIGTPQELNTQKIEVGNHIIKQFKVLVESNFATWHSSSQYATALNITADHLNRTIKSFIGKTAKEYIQTRICIAAERMLYFSDLSTKEIAYQLGFSEPANFSTFFKKATGMSPSQFKKTKF